MPPDDHSERAAEQKAAEVMSGPERNSAPGTISAAAGLWRAALAPGCGRPIEEAARAFLEPRFGFDFRNVRVHTGPEAGASARALGARAYALGPDLVFGAGQYAPSTQPGRHLLAHELAHVIQPGGGSQIRRQGVTTRTWNDIWQEFEKARGLGKLSGPGEADQPELATALANELAKTPPQGDELIEHGMELVSWLQTHGSSSTALRVLADVRQAFRSQQVSGAQAGSVGTPVVGQEQDPEILIAQGKQAAGAGNHDQAAQFLGTANEILWAYVRQVSSEKTTGHPGAFQYPALSALYARLREIYSVYPELEEAAQAAGDTKRAQEARQHGEDLRTRLAKEFTPKDLAPVGDAELAELTLVRTGAGDALRLIGADDVTTDLTQLPGLSPPSQVAEKTGGTTMQAPIEELQTALMGQADLQAELAREPKIRKAFPKGPIDLNDTATRLKAWAVMYSVYKDSSSDPLGSLMTLIGKYLKAYTHHTFYNIRDFGENYITSRFPVNAAGQAERDCGVYALMVAWDVFETVKHGGAGLDVSFKLEVMLDHIILVIDDKSTGRTYIVSNDRITSVDPVQLPPTVRDPDEEPDPRRHGISSMKGGYVKRDPGEAVTEEYANVRNLPYLVSPQIEADLGSTTSKSEGAFRADIWQIYKTKTGQAAAVTKGLDAKLAAINARLPGGRGAVAGTFEAQEGLNNALRDLDARMDQIEKLKPADLAEAVNRELVGAAAVLTLFEMIARSDQGPAPKHPVQVASARKIHPLVRFAQLALQVDAQGGKLTATFPGTKDGKKATLNWMDFVDHCRGFFGTKDLPLPSKP
ncbi:MAG TPA: DUF4157 domain-containing protein [Bryobacteraceae bacterium]|nr:DUF4157 domain-containing protein [Bryobacteraceae bacterium]